MTVIPVCSISLAIGKVYLWVVPGSIVRSKFEMSCSFVVETTFSSRYAKFTQMLKCREQCSFLSQLAATVVTQTHKRSPVCIV
jgi:hypothetical protein